LIPQEFQAEGLIEAMTTAGIPGQRVLIPRAAEAREVLPEQLRAAGAEVRVVIAYRTIPSAVESQRLKDMLRRQDIHAITFTSSSTVRNFCALFDSLEELKKLTEAAAVACIGPITAQTAREHGLPVTIQAAQNTVPALVEAIVQHFAEEQGRGSG
jgi:uroporphyrinogen III methyltransferase/synthase